MQNRNAFPLKGVACLCLLVTWVRSQRERDEDDCLLSCRILEIGIVGIVSAKVMEESGQVPCDRHWFLNRYGAVGYDFGAGVTTILALDHPESVIGIHLTTLESDLTPAVDDAELSEAERSYLAVNQEWNATERGYSTIQSTKPQTVGYGLNDSPAGLAAYVGEKWHSPLFGKSQSLASGQFASPTPGNRSVIFQANFSF
jgi:hypothetical protein